MRELQGFDVRRIKKLPLDMSFLSFLNSIKKVDTSQKETPEQVLDRAMQQIEDKRYVAELEAAGVQNILQLAIAFRGKELWVREQRTE